MASFWVCAFMRPSPPNARIQHQAVNDLAILQMGAHDFIDVRGVHIGVPNALGIDHGYRSARAPVQTSCLVDPNAARAIQIGFADRTLAVVKGFLSMVLGARGVTVLALIQAKENMAFKVRGGRDRRGWRSGYGHGAL